MNTERTSQQIMNDIYGTYWRNEKTHGPAKARVSLLRRVKQRAIGLRESDWMLDLGAGRQVLERQMSRDWDHAIKAQTVTIDIAKLKRKQLLKGSDTNVHHTRGDGAHLPYSAASFAMVISSMGLELMPTSAIAELARVLRPDGKAFLNVLDPSISTNKRDLVAQPKRATTASERRSQDFWNHYAREDNIFNKGDLVIQRVMEEFGLNVNRIETIQAYDTAWIEIDATRTRTPATLQNPQAYVNGLEKMDLLGAGQPKFLRDVA